MSEFVAQADILLENQCGFRKGYQTSDHIFTLFSLIDHYVNKKRKKLFLCFVDFRKAFDKVEHTCLWNKLIQYKINGKFLRLIKAMYERVKSCVRSKYGLTEFFRYKSPTQRKIYSKFRLSSHELEIEQGRYGAKSIPADQRYCKLCKTSKVEDEFHFVIECPIYEKESLNLMEYAEEHFKNVAELQAFDKFIWLMSQEDPLCILKVAKFLQKANYIRQKEIQLRLLNK